MLYSVCVWKKYCLLDKLSGGIQFYFIFKQFQEGLKNVEMLYILYVFYVDFEIKVYILFY